jgi:hypothetical protein
LGDGFKDLDVACAAAEIAGKPFANFFESGLRFFVEQMNGREDHAGSANAALRAAAIEKRLLQNLQTAVGGETFDCDDAYAIRLKDWNKAAIDERSIEQNGTGTALAFSAAFLGARQAKLVP